MYFFICLMRKQYLYNNVAIIIPIYLYFFFSVCILMWHRYSHNYELSEKAGVSKL